MFITEAASMPALQTAGSALPGNGDGFLRIGLDLAVSMFAPCLLGCRGTARQRPVQGGSGSRGPPHGPAGDSITLHQEVLSNTLSSGLLICGRIGPVAGVPAGNQMTLTCASVQGRPVARTLQMEPPPILHAGFCASRPGTSLAAAQADFAAW